VVQASAGTGKTYLLEHLVMDRLLASGAGIDEILVVTFTEKAAAELKARIRAKIGGLLSATTVETSTTASSFWTIDDRARARLQRALAGFDRAAVFTIHGFCHRVLSENAFAGRRLFAETLIDARAAFSAAFKDVLRRDLACRPQPRAYLLATLGLGKTVQDIENLLYESVEARGELGPAFDAERLETAAAEFAKLGARRAELAGRKDRQGAAACRRVNALLAVCDGAAGAAEILARIERAQDEYERRDLFSYLRGKLPDSFVPAFEALDAAAVPFPAALVQTFLPAVIQAVDRRKRESGLLDYQDMLELLAAALAGPGGDELAERLRRQYRYAFIDEFQDTDELQWKIFRTIFFDRAGSESAPAASLVVVGDPKQAIYGFRGADFATYTAAVGEIAAAGGSAVALSRNFRSTAPLIEAVNEILKPDAFARFFSEPSLDDGGATCARPELAAVDGAGANAQPVRLLRVVAQGRAPRIADVKRALASRIAREIRALLAGGARVGPRDRPRPLTERDIFVVTRTRHEAAEIGAALRDASIRHAHYKQTGLLQTDEAKSVRDVLAAIDDPRDRSKRLRAWLTPFFGIALADLERCADPPDGHPLLARLVAWKALADAHDYEALFSSLVEDSGLARREIFLGAAGGGDGGERALINYLHIFEVLLEEAGRARPTLRDLLLSLGSLIAKNKAAGEIGDLQRLESDGSSVALLSMHMAKGLEAEVVFLYGGFSGFPHRRWSVRVWHDGTRRMAHVGKPNDPRVDDAVEHERTGEDQRLLYVGLTRARSLLYLPYFPDVKEEEGAREITDVETFERLAGCYKHLNRRLRVIAGGLAASPALSRLFRVDTVTCSGGPTAPELATPSPPAPPAAWQPPPELLAIADHASDLAELARRHTGFAITSYTRLKASQGGYAAPAAVEPAEGELPGGPAVGIYLHELMEKVALGPLSERPPLWAWAARDDVRALFGRCMARHGREPAALGPSQRLVHAALTAPVRLDDAGTLPCLAAAGAGRNLREMEFVYPFRAGTAPQQDGFVKGFVDFVFEHAGRVYFVDWKSDLLPDYAPAAVASHVARNYALQARLYTLAFIKALDIHTPSDHHDRFGGLVFCFLRGMRTDGDGTQALCFQRPAWDDVRAWDQEVR